MIEKRKDGKRGTDEPFLRLMEIGGAAVLKLLGVDADEAERYRFRSVVLKEKRLEPDIEGLPVLEGGGRRVFVEFQGYADNFIRYRLIAKVMAACAVDRYQGKVLAAIVYTDKAWRNAALPVSPFDERANCKFADCLTEVALTEYSEGQLIAVDPRLVVLAPFTVPHKGGKKELLSRGRGWKDEVTAFYPAHSVHDALTVMGLFILNRFRDITREEVVAMLDFDLMDTVAGRQVYEEGLEKGLEKGLLEEARDMVIEALGERFGIVPGEIIDTVRSIGRREVLKDLLRLAIRSRHIEEFKEMLAKAG